MTLNRDEPPDGKGTVFPWLRRTVAPRSLTAWRAAGTIALITFAVTVVGGVLIRLVDPDGFPSIGSGLWWSVQTLTTVGYGDLVPDDTAGRVIATVVMLNGIAFLTVITAAVTALLIEQLRQRRPSPEPEAALVARLDEIGSRLQAIETTLAAPPDGRGRPGAPG